MPDRATVPSLLRVLGSSSTRPFFSGSDGDEEDGLVLKAGVVDVEGPAPLLRGDAKPLVVPELGEPFPDLLPLGDVLQVGEGDLVLGLHPGLGLGAVVVLQPAVGIGHLGAEKSSTTSPFRVAG